MAPWGRHGDHLLLLYTGGTTGMPKGVMWRQDDLFRALDQLSRRRLPPPADVADLAAQLDRPGPSSLPAAPLMHGTGLVQRPDDAVRPAGRSSPSPAAISIPSNSSTPCERERVKSMTIVGDAFGRPILRALDADPIAVGHLVAARHHLVRRDVVEGDQGRPAPPQRPADPRRHVGIVGGDRDGHQRDDRRRPRRRRRRSGSPPTRG